MYAYFSLVLIKYIPGIIAYSYDCSTAVINVGINKALLVEPRRGSNWDWSFYDILRCGKIEPLYPSSCLLIAFQVNSFK